MDHSTGIAFYGGTPVNMMVDPERAVLLKDVAVKLPDITLMDHHLCDLELLATGAFSPLTGFMIRSDYESVLDRMRLQNGLLWPVPVCLDVNESVARQLEVGQSVALRDPEGLLLAIMELEDIWPVNREKEADLLFGTSEPSHPGRAHLFNAVRDVYIGGRVDVLSLPLHYDFKQHRLTPGEIRHLQQKLGWKRTVAFHTFNVIHRPQFEITLSAMRQAQANLLLMPSVAMTRQEDFNYYTRVRCYREMMRRYPPESALVSLLPHFLRMADVKDDIMNAIIARNFGCTHMILEHYHSRSCLEAPPEAPPSADAIKETMAVVEAEIGIQSIFFDQMVYLPFEDEFRTQDQVPPDTRTRSFSGADIHERIRTGRKVPSWATFPEVLDELQKTCPPPRRNGFTVFFTGLSGAGKSTVARVLYSRFLEIGDRPVTLLDGDIVRQNLSSELSFSKEHRDINVRRIGFVAREITKNRGIAICAPIAPYADTRNEIRKNIEAEGGFVEIHVSTPIDECERRDRKGNYAKARAGLIKGYTGVDDPYEIPEFPEVRIDTTKISPDEAAQEVLIFLGQKGYI